MIQDGTPEFNAQQDELARQQRVSANNSSAALQEWFDKTDWIRKTLQPHELGKHIADVLRERLEAQPAGAATPAAPAPGATLGRDQIRAIFMQHGFTIKEGQTDLKQYVYDAADALLAAQQGGAA